MRTVCVEGRFQRLMTLTQVDNSQAILEEIGKEANLRHVIPVLWATLISPSSSVLVHSSAFSLHLLFWSQLLMSFLIYPSHLYCHSSLTVQSGRCVWSGKFHGHFGKTSSWWVGQRYDCILKSLTPSLPWILVSYHFLSS